MSDTTSILLVAGGIIAVLGWLIVNLFNRIATANAAHARCADALATKDRKLSAIRDLLDTPRTIRKGELAAVLDGDA